MTARAGVRNPASRITITEIKLSEIDVPSYQRKRLNHARIKDIVDNYDQTLDEPMTVVPERNGRYSLVDGQHKFLAKGELGHRTATCRVITRAGKPAQAKFFGDLNEKRTGLNPMDKFRSDLEAGVADVIEMDEALRSQGFRISGTEAPGKPITAVGAVKRIYKMGGKKLVVKAMELIQGAWPDDGEAHKSYYIGGVGRFLHTYGDEVDMARLRMRLASVRPIELKHRGAALADFSSQHSRDAGMTRAIADAYNYRLSVERRLELV